MTSKDGGRPKSPTSPPAITATSFASSEAAPSACSVKAGRTLPLSRPSAEPYTLAKREHPAEPADVGGLHDSATSPPRGGRHPKRVGRSSVRTTLSLGDAASPR